MLNIGTSAQMEEDVRRSRNRNIGVNRWGSVKEIKTVHKGRATATCIVSSAVGLAGIQNGSRGAGLGMRGTTRG
eukprot:768536-Hanusia_phi.AAC.10